MANKVLYLIGSLRNARIPELASRIRADNPDTEVFDDWYAAGPEADDYWKRYEQERSRTYQQALEGYAAKNVFNFDRNNLRRATHALLVLPAGKSGHMEIMYAAYGVGARAAILLDPDDVRWDVMYQFIPTILNNDEEINGWLQSSQEQNTTTTSQDLNWFPDQPLKDLRRCSVSEPVNMLPTTGAVVLNTAASLGLLSDTSKPSTMEKTSTRKAR